MRTSRGAGKASGMVIAVGLLVAGLAGCSSSSNNSNGPVQNTTASTQPSTTSAVTTAPTSTSSATPSVPPSAASSGPSGSASASASGTPTSTASSAPTGPTSAPPTKPSLPSSCSSLLDSETLTNALGKSLDGETTYIKGVAEPKIDRTGRTTCRYGVKGKDIPVEVGVSGYSTVDAATNRMDITINAEVDAGAQKVPVKVANLDGTVLLGKNGSTILVQLQNRTVAITLAPKLATDPQKALTQIAGTVMANLP